MELIIYPNPRIDKALLLESIKMYSKKTNKGVNMRILESIIKTHDLNEDIDVLQIFLEIRQYQFYCKAYDMQDGKVDKNKTVNVKASWETIPIYYTLEKQGNDNYRVERDNELFYLLNYALQQRGKVMPGNNQGFKNLSYNEIINPLNNLNFKATAKNMHGNDILMPVIEEDAPING